MQMPYIESESQSAPRIVTHRLSRAVLAGFVASLAMLFSFLLAYNLARLLSIAPVLARPGAALPQAWLGNLTHNRLIDAGLADVYVAAGVYLAGGLLWAIVYSLVEPRLPGPAWVRGVLFALVPALLSVMVVLPLLGGGMFGLALGAGPLPIIGNLLLHIIYGATLGLVYGPLGDLDASTLRRPATGEDVALTSWYEPMSAGLLVGGLIVGALVGVAIDLATGPGSGLQALGGSSVALVLWGALLGAMMGLLIGPFLAPTEPGPYPDQDRQPSP
jgi:hypothetical protein